MVDLQDVADAWLTKFAVAVFSGDVAATVDCFIPNGWLRDVLIFTWDTRSLEGREKIAAYLQDTLSSAHISNFKLDEKPGLKPEHALDRAVATGFTFETPDRTGRGYAYLVKDDGSSEWKALSVFMMVEEIKDHEELGPELGVYGGHTLSWEEVNAARRAAIESDPYVVIIGAGQTGLNIAARFKQMNIPTIVVERNRRVGDQWRQRYPTLSLHTTRAHHTLLYQPYPLNWPKYTPRDKVADWLEQYVHSQDLIVWTNSHILPDPIYDVKEKRWHIVVSKDGSEVKLNPAHTVICVGTLGAPSIPDVPDRDVFQGDVIHASTYKGGEPYAGKKTIVVGAGNTSADICQDLSFRGAKSVTMVQRSSTCVVSSKTIAGVMSVAFPDGVPYEICDIKYWSMPLNLQRKMARAREALMWETEKDLHDQLKKGGLKLNMGRDGSGQHFLIYERSGGFWIDVGCGPLIGSGTVKVKQGVELKRLTKNGAVFTDDSEVEADLVVFATGYLDPRDSLKETFGKETIEQTSPLWGLDEEGEIRGAYRRSGHPGIWYGAGDFSMSRPLSKQLALQIKAIQLGMMPQ
ncbi:FAD/NAD-P-binding domain-containing protein [Laetiporus sulphureus 93-53]|uniref:FAD/NAD-P-binding domain-containing protein n=1 Tax=Laetiporus sulphureus 93-53 TaxID=1314785 RepID=A0A165BHD9_9APHY|nr:FAD/NAD-P-binding domain-containing protein [Laetiporus sulphureus 93-53]KZT01059.1 FAD/NAD-P-binding domain-containing protein [Laetiporus sulphureus 93-53]